MACNIGNNMSADDNGGLEASECDKENLLFIIRLELEHYGINLDDFIDNISPRLAKRSKDSKKGEGRKDSVFGQDLTEAPKTCVSVGNKSIQVPFFVAEAAAVIRANITKKGLFRVAGTVSRQKKIIEAINNGKDLNEYSFAINDLCSIFKLYIRKLPEPLVSQTVASVLFKCLEVEEESKRNVLLFNSLLLLNREHLDLLFFLCGFMNEVAQHSEENGMDLESVVKMFAPNITQTDSDHANLWEVTEKLNQLLLIFAKEWETIGIVSNELEQQLHELRRSSSENALDAKPKKRRRSSSLGRSVMDGFRRIVRGMSPTRQILRPREENDNIEVFSATPDPLRTPCIKSKRKSDLPTLSAKKKKVVQDSLPSGDLLPNTPFRRDYQRMSISPRETSKKSRSPLVAKKGILKNKRFSSSPTASTSRRARWSIGKRKTKDKLSCPYIASSHQYRSLRAKYSRHHQPNKLEVCKEDKAARKRKSMNIEVQAEVHHRQDSILSNQVMIVYDEKKSNLHKNVSSNQLQPLAKGKKQISSNQLQVPTTDTTLKKQPSSNRLQVASIETSFNKQISTNQLMLPVTEQSLSRQASSNSVKDADRCDKTSSNQLETPPPNTVCPLTPLASLPDDLSVSMDSVSSPPPLPPRATPIPSSETLQDVFEETLKKTEELNMGESERLARQLSDKLKIRGRRSAENTPKRSPCQRKIKAIKRRSRELQKSYSAGNLSRRSLHNVKKRRSIAGAVDAAHARNVIMKSIRRGKPNTVRAGLPTPVKGVHTPNVMQGQSKQSLITKFSEGDSNDTEMKPVCENPNASVKDNDVLDRSSPGKDSSSLPCLVGEDNTESTPRLTRGSLRKSLEKITFQHEPPTPLQYDFQMEMEEDGVDIESKSISDIFIAQSLENRSPSNTPKTCREEAVFSENADKTPVIERCKEIDANAKFSPVASLTDEVLEMLSINKDDYPLSVPSRHTDKGSVEEPLHCNVTPKRDVEPTRSKGLSENKKSYARERRSREVKHGNTREALFEVGKCAQVPSKDTKCVLSVEVSGNLQSASEDIEWVPAVEAFKDLQPPTAEKVKPNNVVEALKNLEGSSHLGVHGRDSLNILKEKKCVLQMKEKFNNMLVTDGTSSVKKSYLTPNRSGQSSIATRGQSFHGGSFVSGRKTVTPKVYNAEASVLMPSPSEFPRKLSVWTPKTESKIPVKRPTLQRSKATLDTRASFHCSPVKKDLKCVQFQTKDKSEVKSPLQSKAKLEVKSPLKDKSLQSKDKLEVKSPLWNKDRLEIKSPLRNKEFIVRPPLRSNSMRYNENDAPRRSPRLQAQIKRSNTLKERSTNTPTGSMENSPINTTPVSRAERKIGTPRSRLDRSKPYRSNREATMWKSPKYSKAHGLVAVPQDKLPSAKYAVQSESQTSKLPLRDSNSMDGKKLPSSSMMTNEALEASLASYRSKRMLSGDLAHSKENTFTRRGSGRNSNRSKAKARHAHHNRTPPRKSCSYSQVPARLGRRSPRFHSVM